MANNDTTKSCGTCEFWDRENAMNSPHYANRKLAVCKFPVPISVPKTMVYEDQGQDCQVYLERGIEKHNTNRIEKAS